MLLERIRIAGIAMLVAALSVTGWKSFAGRRAEAMSDDAARSASNFPADAGSVLMVPVEIVEAGQEPRLHEVRLSR